MLPFDSNWAPSDPSWRDKYAPYDLLDRRLSLTKINAQRDLLCVWRWHRSINTLLSRSLVRSRSSFPAPLTLQPSVFVCARVWPRLTLSSIIHSNTSLLVPSIRRHQAKSNLFEHSSVGLVVMISACTKQGHRLLLSYFIKTDGFLHQHYTLMTTMMMMMMWIIKAKDGSEQVRATWRCRAKGKRDDNWLILLTFRS